MSAPRSPHRVGSSLKRKRPTAQDFIDDQPPNRPLADISNMCSPYDRSDHPYTYSPPDRRDSSPPRGPRGYRDRDEAEFRFTTDRMKLRDRERDRDPPYRERSRSPDRRHSSGRYETRDYERGPSASTHRSVYTEPIRAGIHSDPRGLSSTRTSVAGSPYPHPDLRKEQPVEPQPVVTVLKVDTGDATAAAERAHAQAAIDLAGVFKKLIDEATDSAALKTQRNAAEKKLEKRAAEYLKSKPHHEKFPSTEESQRRAKEQAEKEFKVVDEKFKAKDTSLNNLAAEAAASVLPSISRTGAVDKDEQHKWQNRYEDLEKTCVTLNKQLEDQQKFLEDEKKLRVQLEGKFEAIDAKYKNAHASWAETKGRQASFDKDIRPQMQERILGSEKKIENLKEDFTKTKASFVELSTRFANQQAQIPSGLPQRLEKVDNLSKRLDDLSDLRTRFSKAKEESAQIAKTIAEKSKAFDTVDRLELIVMGNGTEDVPNLRATCLQLARDQEHFRTELKRWPDLEARLRNVENRPAPTTYDNRLKALERTSSLHKSPLETDSELAAKVKVIESGQLEIKSKFERRLGALEAAKATAPLLPGKPTTPDSNLISSVRSLEDQVKNIDSIEKRVNNGETSGESFVNTPELANIRSDVATIRTTVGLLEKAQSDLSSKVSENHVDPIKFEKRLVNIAEATKASFDRRLSVLEKQPQPAGGTAAPADATVLSRLDTLREDFESFKSSQEAADDYTASCLDTAKNTAARLVTAEVKILQLETVNTSYKPLLELPTKFDSLVKDQVRSVQQYQSVLNDARSSIVTDSVAEAIKVIQSHPEVLPSAALENRVMNTIGQLNNKIGELDNRVEGNSQALVDFDKRWQTINTRDMSNYILGQLSETYPNVKEAQAQLVALDTSLRNTKSQLIVLDLSFQGLQAQVQKLENRPQQSPAPAPAEGGRLSSLRKDVDKVTEDLMKEHKTARSAAKDVKECKDALSSLQENYTKLHHDVAHTLGELHVKVDELKETDVANLDRRMNNLRDNEIAQLESRLNSLKDNEQALAQQIANLNKVPTASPAPSNASRSTATVNGTKPHKVLQAPFSPPPAPANCQASMESSASNKRRKLVNGTATSTAASRINGVNGRGRSGSNTASPQKKRRRRSDVTSDYEDPDYEIPQPGVSSDDEDSASASVGEELSKRRSSRFTTSGWKKVS